MSVQRLDEACRALSEGQAVIVANPSPMTYGIIATNPLAVNALKQRPPEQNVAVSLHDEAEWRGVAASLDISPGHVPRIRELLRARMALLLPLRDSYPDWIEPAVREGQVAVFNGWWEPLAQVWGGFPRLYGSSANRTGQPPAASAVQAIENFGADAVVVDADALRDLDREHAATSMVRVERDGQLSLHRRGAQDAYAQRLSTLNLPPPPDAA